MFLFVEEASNIKWHLGSNVVLDRFIGCKWKNVSSYHKWQNFVSDMPIYLCIWISLTDATIGVTVAEKSLAPDWELRSKVVGSNQRQSQQCFIPRLQKNQQGTLSQGNSSLQWP